MLFDSHAHLNDERFDEDRDQLIDYLRENDVDLVVNPGADMETSKTAIDLAKKHDFIYAAVGVHPHDVEHMTEDDIETLKKWARENDKVVAIGEIGLDYYYDLSPRDLQKKWFNWSLFASSLARTQGIVSSIYLLVLLTNFHRLSRASWNINSFI